MQILKLPFRLLKLFFSPKPFMLQHNSIRDIGSIIGIGGSIISGIMGKDAASDAAAAQARGADKGIQFQREALDAIRGDLSPYRDIGEQVLYGGARYDQAAYDQAVADFNALDPLGSKTNKRGKTIKGRGFITHDDYKALSPEERLGYEMDDKGRFIRKAPKLEDFKLNPSGGLLDLVTNPTAQKDYVMNNPFFEALAGKASNTLLSNQAARGKIGSGGTAEALQNSLMLLGTDLLNQSITQRQNLANMGQSAAAQTGAATQEASKIMSGISLGQGNAIAGGIMGANGALQDMTKGVTTGLQNIFSQGQKYQL